MDNRNTVHSEHTVIPCDTDTKALALKMRTTLHFTRTKHLFWLVPALQCQTLRYLFYPLETLRLFLDAFFILPYTFLTRAGITQR